METVSEFINVSKVYKNRHVLNDVTFSIGAGEMVALTGPSGSGKSTILNLIGLLEAPDQGEIRLFGSTAPKPKSRIANRYLRTRLGYLFQNYALIDQATVEQNLKVAQKYAAGNPAARRNLRTEALTHLGLDRLRNSKVYTLSGGEQQRVAVARLTLKPCELILADEPTGSLDPANRDRILEQLHELNTTGKTVVIVTHDHEVAAACHRVIQLASTPMAQ